jgi:carboxylate-amine ligase
MPLEPFAHSEPLTFGVELELQLLNTFDFDLTPMASDLMRVVEAERHPGDIKPEITQSMIEISTRVHTRHGELVTDGRGVPPIARARAGPWRRWRDERT